MPPGFSRRKAWPWAGDSGQEGGLGNGQKPLPGEPPTSQQVRETGRRGATCTHPWGVTVPPPPSRSYLDEVELVRVPGLLRQRVCVIQDPCMGSGGQNSGPRCVHVEPGFAQSSPRAASPGQRPLQLF